MICDLILASTVTVMDMQFFQRAANFTLALPLIHCGMPITTSTILLHPFSLFSGLLTLVISAAGNQPRTMRRTVFLVRSKLVWQKLRAAKSAISWIGITDCCAFFCLDPIEPLMTAFRR